MKNTSQPQAPQYRVLPWHNKIYHCISSLNLLPNLRSGGIDASHCGYEEPYPWEPPPAAFLTNSLPRAKAKCSPSDLRKLRDGSVNPESGRTGGTFLCGDHEQASRLSNGSSILRAELSAIHSALAYALFCIKPTLCILIDSLSALHTLQNRIT